MTRAKPSPKPRRAACARCGTIFDCAGGGPCWCAEEAFRLPMPAPDSGEDCLCPTCLRTVVEAAQPNTKA